MLEHTFSSIKKQNSHIQLWFLTTAGVVQGSVISPLLYGVFISDLVEALQSSESGYHFLHHEISALLYCDDIILIASSSSALLKLLEICEQHSVKWKYQFNPDKFNILSHNYRDCVSSVLKNIRKFPRILLPNSESICFI